MNYRFVHYPLVQRIIQVLISFSYVIFLLKQFFLPDSPLMAASVHVYMAVALVFAFKPFESENPIYAKLGRVFDLGCIALALLICANYVIEMPRLENRLEMIDEILPVDTFNYFVGLALLFEGVRRSVGMSLLCVIAFFLVYAYSGNYFPGWFAFPGFDTVTLTEMITMKTEGLFGVTASTAVNLVFFFVMFGAIFSSTGGGGIFIDLAMLVTARMKGGAAKMSLLGSALFGMVSGSAVANATSTGVLSIPIMQRAGYKKEQAAAIEALGSTGGQLAPPIMGVAAFVMADMLGVPYADIAAAGIIPAVAFYFALFLMVDLLARKKGVGNFAAEDIKIEPVKPRLHLLLSPVVLIACLIIGYSAPYSAFIGSVVALLAPLLRKSTRYPLIELYKIVMDVAKQMAWVSVPLAAVGIVMVVATQSNLALKFVEMLTGFGGTSLYLSLIMVILGCIVMGMGLPTVAAYIIGSITFVPALIDLGVDRLAANFFVMYYCVLSMITPPVALVSYATAAVAKADSSVTGILAFSYSLVIFLVPFSFINDPHVLWQGSMISIMVALFGILCATFAWSVFLQGWLNINLNILERLLFLMVSLAIVVTPTFSFVWSISIASLFVLVLWCWKVKPQWNPVVSGVEE